MTSTILVVRTLFMVMSIFANSSIAFQAGPGSMKWVRSPLSASRHWAEKRCLSHALQSCKMSSALQAQEDSVDALKYKIIQIAAMTDRGQRLNKLVAPMYQEKREQIAEMAKKLCKMECDVSETTVSGDWELVYSDVELFRSSPFFLAIERALDTSPGIPWLGKMFGITDPTKKSQMFFKLHQLQVLSWGASTVGQITQKIDFEKKEFESAFDTVLFGLTVIPILGWFKLLPTFGGRVVTIADKLELQGNELVMELAKTQVIDVPGVKRIPLVSGLLMDRWYPVRGVWKTLPWNGGPFEGRAPDCRVSIEYVDEGFRITKDLSGALFVYTRPLR